MNYKNVGGINVKARLKNRVFLSSLAGVIALLVSKVALDFFGVDISEQVKSILEIVEYVLIILVMLGVIVDPTVKGIADSDYSLTKEEPSDQRELLEVKEEGDLNKDGGDK